MLEFAVEVAREAGMFLKRSVGGIRAIETKEGQETNLVTEIDKKSEAMIIGAVKRRYPHHGFLGEETGSTTPTADTIWIIDPLDGTTNFTHGLPIFCVSIGIQEKGGLVAGVVYDPNRDEMFTAQRGRGSYLNGKKIRVSEREKLIKSLLVTGFPYNVRENPLNAVEHFGAFLKESQAVRRLGSAALDFAYVAAGRFDGFWEVALHPWDMAAGLLLVEEAGGKVTDFRGFPTTVMGKSIVATNGRIHEQMISILKKNLA
ncbi:MAG TPA: inositol monophosphatase [Bacteroidetes bacterium]|nr:MAG: inositol monophosphatase [Ignavibacteria bacterium GWC2_56_12]HAV23156.1 inositol monophosphatase [Bacteroidota bacterium]